MRMLRALEIACFTGGLALAGLCALALADGAVHVGPALASIEAEAAVPSGRSEPADRALAALRVSAVGLTVPVYGDTRPLHLNRGAGLIVGTARPGEGGNIGIAGHRDGVFRPLKDIRNGDVIHLRTPDREYQYRVAQIAIVDRTDARLLAPTAVASITLVTCYPFYFIGHAPKRFVVRGVLEPT